MNLAKLRRLSQILFLALFLFLLYKTEFRGSFQTRQGDLRLPYPVGIFLEADPLAALSNVFASGALYRGLLWSLVILIPTFVLGRFFCGWICPLGTLNHWFGSFKSEKRRGLRLLESNRYKRWQALKYYLLIALLAAVLFGSGLAGLLDPIALTVRSLGLSVLPALNYALGFRLAFKQPHFGQGFLLGLIFLAVLLANLRVTRFFCRAVCPLGALLGAISRWSILGLEKRPSRCEDCNRCLLHCQGGDDPIPGAPWRKAECHLCLNCIADCPDSGLAFRFFPDAGTTRFAPDLRRRAALASLAGGAALTPIFRTAAADFARRVRPPGALDEKAFLARCIRCGECMKVCPNNALQASFAEAGLEGLWTPVLVARIGYCEPSCVLCGQVCPTGAIWEFTGKDKGWIGAAAQPIRIGTAFYDHGRCLPWSMAAECIVCEEWCPTTPKAIYLRPAEAFNREGKPVQIRQPYVDPAKCVGCGACEYACPVKDRPAVYVTSIGESRSKSNQILLRRAAPKTASPFPESGEVPGWKRLGETRTFPAGRLWEYINGDADRYLQAGVQRALTTGYRFQDRIDAVADIYVFAQPAGARRIMESESAEGSRPIEIGNAARLYGASLTFCQGNHFVRLIAYQEAPENPNALRDLALAINRRLTLLD
ncbi:MAG: 4Fe-4S dicluster domain-containing protein [Acidobacteria bacterium]|nr:4Fe-4S dicluster domain-containing protein [Acidobacteriota bacterium]